jgi:excisionase family DNA binding protein
MQEDTHHRLSDANNARLTYLGRLLMAEPLLSAAEVADYFQVPLATLYRWNSIGTGPRRIRVGKHVRYRRVDVEAWLDLCADSAPAG